MLMKLRKSTISFSFIGWCYTVLCPGGIQLGRNCIATEILIWANKRVDYNHGILLCCLVCLANNSITAFVVLSPTNQNALSDVGRLNLQQTGFWHQNFPRITLRNGKRLIKFYCFRPSWKLYFPLFSHKSHPPARRGRDLRQIRFPADNAEELIK